MCGALGSLALANFLPSVIYELSATSNDCIGPYCFGPTHAVIAALCAVSCVASLIVSARTLPLYTQIAAGATTDLL